MQQKPNRWLTYMIKIYGPAHALTVYKKPSFETRIFHENLVNTMNADALAPLFFTTS